MKGLKVWVPVSVGTKNPSHKIPPSPSIDVGSNLPEYEKSPSSQKLSVLNGVPVKISSVSSSISALE